MLAGIPLALDGQVRADCFRRWIFPPRKANRVVGNLWLTWNKVSDMAERILVVDDDESMRKMLEAFLTMEGYRVETAEGLRAAVEAMESNEYHIMLIDKNMPGINGNGEGGIDLLRHVRSTRPSSAVIMMSGNPTADTTAKAMELGVAWFMSKPFSLMDLGRKIKILLQKPPA